MELLLALLLAQAPPAPPAPEARPPLVDSSRLKSPVEITARKVSGGRTQATFTGDVLVKHRTLDLRCERMVAFYNGPREVTRVECVGNVQAVDGDKTARGERAEFDVPTGVLVVTGNPEARQGNSFLTGSLVRFTVGDENLEVENARVVVETAPLRKRRRTPAPPTGGSSQP